MTVEVADLRVQPSAPADGRVGAHAGLPARPVAVDWPATRAGLGEVLGRLARAPFACQDAETRNRYGRGQVWLLRWLSDQPGQTWQQRWLASGADAAGGRWRQVAGGWLRESGRSQWAQPELSAGLMLVISADVVRPSLSWLVAGGSGKGALVRALARSRDVEGFALLRRLCDDDPGMSAAAGRHTLHRCSLILAAKGGTLADITIGDVLELLDLEAATHPRSTGDTAVFYRLLHQMGIFGPAAPATLRQLRSTGQRTPQELIDRYQLVCRPVRDLLVDYLRERQPALDYSSLTMLAWHLGKNFWQDLERHHPGIDSLHLPAETAQAWKQRLRTKPTTLATGAGDKHVVEVERLSYRECLTPVRALYLDLAQWALTEPGRWARWVAPCPVGAQEVNSRKAARRRKSRMDARTRERLPVLPILVATVDQRRKDTDTLLQAARNTPTGQTFTAAGQTLLRPALTKDTPGKVWAQDPATGRRRDLALEEDHAFWVWAIVEVLRATGVRIEELLEISHHNLVQYLLPTTGELVPLLQINPSKTDSERLLVVSPELADVLSAIICRLRDPSGRVPLVPAYDAHEHVWLAPSPLLFQRRFGAENRRISDGTVRNMLTDALAHTGLLDPADGGPLHYTPHDFRRIFITDAILSGLPPHIAQVIAGHQDINVTLGYKAVYPAETIQAHLAFLARRRALRPTEEYRAPTDTEWQEFLGHFELRKVATGLCGRAFSSPCIHEHACLRCPMHWPDPAQRPRLVDIRDNLLARIAEAEREGWLGEVEGLRFSLAGAEDKLAQIDKRAASATTVGLGMPSFAHVAGRQTNTVDAPAPGKEPS